MSTLDFIDAALEARKAADERITPADATVFRAKNVVAQKTDITALTNAQQKELLKYLSQGELQALKTEVQK